MLNDQQIIVLAAIERVACKRAGMEAENMRREQVGEAPAYGDSSFADLIDEEGISFNEVLRQLHVAG